MGQLASELTKQFDALCPTELDQNVLAFDVTEFSEPRPHCLDLRLVRGAVEFAHAADAQGRMADQASRVERRRMRIEGVEIIGETLEAVIALFPDQIQRRRRCAIEDERRERDAAIAGHDRGDALTDFRAHIGGDEERAIVVGMDIDESRGDDEPVRVDLAPSAAARQTFHGSDALAVDRDIGAETGGAGAVDHASAAQHQVVVGHCR